MAVTRLEYEDDDGQEEYIRNLIGKQIEGEDSISYWSLGSSGFTPSSSFPWDELTFYTSNTMNEVPSGKIDITAFDGVETMIHTADQHHWYRITDLRNSGALLIN